MAPHFCFLIGLMGQSRDHKQTMSQNKKQVFNPEEYQSPEVEIVLIQGNKSVLVGSPDNERTTEEELF